MDYLQDIPIHHSVWEKLCYALILGALRDIVIFAQCSPLSVIIQQFSSLSYMERRIKMKEYYKIKRNSEKSCEWIDEGKPKKGSKISHISFREACEGLKQDPSRVRNNIKEIVRKIINIRK